MPVSSAKMNFDLLFVSLFLFGYRKTKLWFQSCFVQARLEGFGKTSKRKEFLPLAQDE